VNEAGYSCKSIVHDSGRAAEGREQPAMPVDRAVFD
jgi:hypothetical protein